jgi:glutaredoxin
MGRLLTFAALAFVLFVGWKRFGDRETRRPAVVSAEVMDVDIEIYTTSGCGYCKRAKAYMDEHQIAYVEKNVETDDALLREFHERGGNGVPYFIIDGEPLRGWNPESFEEALARGS